MIRFYLKENTGTYETAYLSINRKGITAISWDNGNNEEILSIARDICKNKFYLKFINKSLSPKGSQGYFVYLNDREELKELLLNLKNVSEKFTNEDQNLYKKYIASTKDLLVKISNEVI